MWRIGLTAQAERRHLVWLSCLQHKNPSLSFLSDYEGKQESRPNSWLPIAGIDFLSDLVV